MISMKQIKNHWGYYLSLALIQLTGLILTFLLSYSRTLQMTVVVMVTTIYTIWALIHHKMEHDLHATIVIEYIVMGAFGISVAFFLLRFTTL